MQIRFIHAGVGRFVDFERRENAVKQSFERKEIVIRAVHTDAQSFGFDGEIFKRQCFWRENFGRFKENAVLIVFAEIAADYRKHAADKSRTHNADVFAKRVENGNSVSQRVVFRKTKNIERLWRDETVSNNFVRAFCGKNTFEQIFFRSERVAAAHSLL